MERTASLLWHGLWLLLAAGLCLLAWPQQLERGCWLGEWPLEDGCTRWPAPEQRLQQPQVLEQHLGRNPGDARAWAQLLGAHWMQQDARAPALLQPVRQLAPGEPGVLVVQAAGSLQAGDWPQAAAALVQLAQGGNADARKALLALTLDPETQPAVAALIDDKARWLGPLLASLPRGQSAAPLQPLVSRGHALGVIPVRTALAMVDRLKAGGDWLDAYTLWVDLHQTVQAPLHNPGFDQHALRRGFDWEWPQQAPDKQGMRVSQVSAAPRPGLMLQVELTGRAALPAQLASQSLVLLDRRYRLQGRYMSEGLRTREGLVWALRCARGPRWAETPALLDTGREWQVFELEFEVPAECAGAVRLQLEPTAAWEARAGMTGKLFFDDFSLLRLAAGDGHD